MEEERSRCDSCEYLDKKHYEKPCNSCMQFVEGYLEAVNYELKRNDKMLEFFICMKLPTATFQDKEMTVRNGKPVIFDSAEVKKIKENFMAHLSKHVPDQMIKPPIRIQTKWCYQTDDHKKFGKYKITKPDVDNSPKALHDCMTKLGFWKGDEQVSSMIVEKFWNDVPGIYIKIETIKE